MHKCKCTRPSGRLLILKLKLNIHDTLSCNDIYSDVREKRTGGSEGEDHKYILYII